MPRPRLSDFDLFHMAGYDLENEPPTAEQLEELHGMRAACKSDFPPMST